MYGRIVMIVIASVVAFASTHSWVAGLGAGLLSLLLMLVFSAIDRFVRGQRLRS
jgi:chromate transport protein ChrA